MGYGPAHRTTLASPILYQKHINNTFWQEMQTHNECSGHQIMNHMSHYGCYVIALFTVQLYSLNMMILTSHFSLRV